MLNKNVALRRATSQDALSISSICKRVYCTVYTPLPSQDELERSLEQDYGLDVAKRDLRDENKEEWVAVRRTGGRNIDGVVEEGDEEIIGLMLLARGKGPPSLDEPEWLESLLEIERVYVDVPHQRSGVGALLMDHAENVAREQVFMSLWLGVWERNENAIKFYRKLEYGKFGEVDWGCQRDWLMGKKLS